MGRGTITLRTGVSVNSNTLWMRSTSRLVEDALLAPFLDQVLDLLLRDEGPRRRKSRIPKRASTPRVEAVSTTTTQRERRAMTLSGQDTRRATVSREPEGQGLGHQLAQDQLDVDDGEADQERRLEGAAGRRRPRARRSKAGLEVAAGDVAAQHPGQGAHDRDADLDRGQEPVHVVLEALHPPGGPAALRDQGLDPAPAGGDDRDLAAGEEAVPEQAERGSRCTR